MLSNAGRVLGSLAWWQYAVDGTFAMKGAQTLPTVILANVILGAVVSATGVGRQFVLAALIGAIPCWVSAGGGNSHRMMMMLLPLALLAGAAPLVVPARQRGAAAAVLVAAIALTGMHTWLSPDFWVRAGVPRSALWTPPVRALVQEELDRSPTATVRVYPNENSVRLLAFERGMPPFALDLRAADFARKDPLTMFWRQLSPAAQAVFARTTSGGAVHVEPLTESLTLMRFPHGWQGLVGDPPQFGWRFSRTCEHPTPESNLDFVVPFILEDSPESGAEPCTFRWSARMRERVDHLNLEGAAIRGGTVCIDDATVPVGPTTELPAIAAGQRIVVEVHGGVHGIRVLLHHEGSLLSWEAVSPAS